jgi:hypothetical protein
MRWTPVADATCDLRGADAVDEHQRASRIESHFLDKAHRAHSSDHAKPMREMDGLIAT